MIGARTTSHARLIVIPSLRTSLGDLLRLASLTKVWESPETPTAVPSLCEFVLPPTPGSAANALATLFREVVGVVETEVAPFPVDVVLVEVVVLS
jgi:hypothetical protein